MPNLWNEAEILEAALDVRGAGASSAIRRLQSRIGYVPPGALEFLAPALRISLAALTREARTTPGLKSTPPKSKTLYVCNGAGCSLPRCRYFAAQVIRTLGIGFNEQTADGALRLKSLRCRETPATTSRVMIDDEVFEIATLGEFEDLLGCLMVDC